MTSRPHEDLEIFVDRLFSGHRKTKAVLELRDEVLSNLEAKVEDYLQEGMEYSRAVSLAIRDIEPVEHLIDHYQTVNLTAYRLDLAQHALLYFLTAWIITLPARFLSPGEIANNMLAFFAAASGMFLIAQVRKSKVEPPRTGSVNAVKLRRLSRMVWLLWWLFAAVVTLFTLMVRFGSNVWFARSPYISGPYELFELGISILLPLLTVVIPLLFWRADKQLVKYEVKGHE